MNRIYCDHNATTPLDPRVKEAMLEVLDARVGNPSSLHAFGREARRRLEDARAEAAAALGVVDREITFTGSATEANNTALFGLTPLEPQDRRRVVASPIEHPSILAALVELERRGFEIIWLPVTREGCVDFEAGAELIDDSTALATTMWVNNETGVIQPIEALAQRCSDFEVPFHVDAVQTLGKLPIDLRTAGITSASFSAHKISGPPGVGTLYVHADSRLRPLIVGGGQERERRAGTENQVGIVGMSKALTLIAAEGEVRRTRLSELDEHFSDRLGHAIEDAVINSRDASRVPGSFSVRLPGLHGETAQMRLDLAGFAVSLGSACSSGSVEASHVLRAMGLSLADNHASLRISFGPDNSREDLDALVNALRGLR